MQLVGYVSLNESFGPTMINTETYYLSPANMVVQTSISRSYGAVVTLGVVGYRRRLPSGADEYVHISNDHRLWACSVHDRRLSSVTIGWALGGNASLNGLVNFYLL